MIEALILALRRTIHSAKTFLSPHFFLGRNAENFHSHTIPDLHRRKSTQSLSNPSSVSPQNPQN
jgi:hypothetical protein